MFSSAETRWSISVQLQSLGGRCGLLLTCGLVCLVCFFFSFFQRGLARGQRRQRPVDQHGDEHRVDRGAHRRPGTRPAGQGDAGKGRRIAFFFDRRSTIDARDRPRNGQASVEGKQSALDIVRLAGTAGDQGRAGVGVVAAEEGVESGDTGQDGVATAAATAAAAATATPATPATTATTATITAAERQRRVVQVAAQRVQSFETGNSITGIV